MQGKSRSLAAAAGVLVIFGSTANAQVIIETGGTRPTSGHIARGLAALPVKDAIRVDGVLDEEAWSRATVARDFTQSEPREGQPATEPTEVMVAFDAQYLYIGARMRDSDPGREIVNDIRKDVGSSRVDLQACKLEYSIVSPK